MKQPTLGRVRLYAIPTGGWAGVAICYCNSRMAGLQSSADTSQREPAVRKLCENFITGVVVAERIAIQALQAGRCPKLNPMYKNILI